MKKRAKVLLLTPNLKGIKDGLNRIQPPLGLMIMAAVLRKNGHQVAIRDTALEGWHRQQALGEHAVLIGQTDDEITRVIRAHDPDIVGISALFSNLMSSAHTIARLVKRAKPETVVVLGGNHISCAVSDYVYACANPASLMPRRLEDLEDTNIDYAMQGEADWEFPRLVDTIAQNQDVSEIPGLVMRDSRSSGAYLINSPPAPLANLSSLPLPARNLVNMEGYFKIGSFHSAKSRSKRVLSVMASRGCPEKCTFCTTPKMWGSIVRWRSTQEVIEEIRQSREQFQIGEIQFEDDTLTARKDNLLELCKELEKVGLPWCTPNGTKVDYHLSSQPVLYKAMADSGCYQITLAAESGVQRVLDQIIHKKLKLEQIMPAIANAKNVGMFVHTFWILGHPGETFEEMEETVRFASICGADSFSFAILSPLPGTPIYREVVQKNLWWPGRSIQELTYRSSLIKVDGFSSSEEFEKYVTEANIRCNKILAEKDPVRFRKKYGSDADERSMIKQT